MREYCMQDSEMAYLYVYVGLIVYHLGIINSLSMVMGRRNPKTFFEINSITSDQNHLLGILLMTIAGFIVGTVIQFGIKSDYVAVPAFTVATILAIGDVILTYKAIKAS
jgi:hypothetical protein